MDRLKKENQKLHQESKAAFGRNPDRGDAPIYFVTGTEQALTAFQPSFEDGGNPDVRCHDKGLRAARKLGSRR